MASQMLQQSRQLSLPLRIGRIEKQSAPAIAFLPQPMEKQTAKSRPCSERYLAALDTARWLPSYQGWQAVFAARRVDVPPCGDTLARHAKAGLRQAELQAPGSGPFRTEDLIKAERECVCACANSRSSSTQPTQLQSRTSAGRSAHNAFSIAINLC